jgi:C-terminal processing protease CtpA/Prc
MAATATLVLLLAFSNSRLLADPPAKPPADDQQTMPKMVVQGNAICSFGISLKCLGDVATKKITRILISSVVEGSRAEFLGLRAGDEILTVNGLKITELKGGMSPDGDIMQLFVNRRKGDPIDLKVAVRVTKDLTLFASPPLLDEAPP